MAVQKKRVTRSKRNMRRSHDSLSGATLSTNQATGETHRRHHIDAAGYYRDKQITTPEWSMDDEE